MSLVISFQHIMTPTTSVGQANFSKTFQSINSTGMSIVRKLASRRLKGNGLRIQIHRHIGFLLHNVCHVTNHNNFKTTKCLERVFTKYGDLHDFCIELKTGLLKAYVIVCVLISSSGWKTKLNHVLLNISHKLDNPMSYDRWNVQNKKQTKEETSFNICAQCRLLTKSVNCSKFNTILKYMYHFSFPTKNHGVL